MTTELKAVLWLYRVTIIHSENQSDQTLRIFQGSELCPPVKQLTYLQCVCEGIMQKQVNY